MWSQLSEEILLSITLLPKQQKSSLSIAYLFPSQATTCIDSASSTSRGSNSKKQKPNYTVKLSKDGRKYYNGVDVTDITRTFSKKEREKLPKAFKTQLYNNPQRKQAYARRRKASSTKTSNLSRNRNNDSRVVSQGKLFNNTITRIVSWVAKTTFAGGDSVTCGATT